MESANDGTSRSILWRRYDESAVTSSVSSSDSGSTCRSQGAKYDPQPTTRFSSSVPYIQHLQQLLPFHQSHPPTPAFPHTISHPQPPNEVPTSHHRPQRRSRSQRHRSESRRPDKRPVSIPRSPRRRRSTRRTRHSPRPRSSSRRFSTSRHASRQPSRATSITLRSHLHNVEKYDIEHKMTTHHKNQLTHQPLSNLHRGNTTHNSLFTTPTLRHNPTTTTNIPPTSGNPEDNGRTIQSPQMHPTLQGGLTTPNHQPVMTTNTTPLPNHSRHSHPIPPHHIARRKNPHTDQVQINPMAQSMSLQDMLPLTFKTVLRKSGFETSGLPWSHPDRMRAANEIPAAERLQPSQTMDHDDYEKACEQLHQVDHRIPPDVIKKAVQLFFSTYLLPDYDLTNSHVRELPATNMLALILPLPDTSHFQMPPPFHKRQNHTWALLHGTSLHTSQQILLEGKIRPANWSYHKNLQRCDMPTFGAFTLAGKYPTVTRPSQNGRKESYSTPSRRKGKDNKTSSLGRCIEEHTTTLPTQLEGMKWRRLL